MGTNNTFVDLVDLNWYWICIDDWHPYPAKYYGDDINQFRDITEEWIPKHKVTIAIPINWKELMTYAVHS